jgi:hypothetical protein
LSSVAGVRRRQRLLRDEDRVWTMSDWYPNLTPEQRDALRLAIDLALQSTETIDCAFYQQRTAIEDITTLLEKTEWKT